MFNVGGDKAITVAEFAQAAAEIFEKKDYRPLPSGKYRYGDTRHIFSDVSKLKALGWAPRRSIKESVAAYRDWLSGAGAAEEILDYSNRVMASLGVVREVKA
jgi:dTDP-L-rhamnose 4-epimerase